MMPRDQPATGIFRRLKILRGHRLETAKAHVGFAAPDNFYRHPQFLGHKRRIYSPIMVLCRAPAEAASEISAMQLHIFGRNAERLGYGAGQMSGRLRSCPD